MKDTFDQQKLMELLEAIQNWTPEEKAYYDAEYEKCKADPLYYCNFFRKQQGLPEITQEQYDQVVAERDVVSERGFQEIVTEGLCFKFEKP